MSFQQIPIIDLAKAANPSTKDEFKQELQDALINVGFLLLRNYELLGGPNSTDLEDIKREAINFFALPEEAKLKCEMLNSPHFLGYTRLANEITSLKTDWREQIDLATELEAPPSGLPLYKNIEGPNLWPDSELIPDFRRVVERHISKMTTLSLAFKSLVVEAIGLDPHALDLYFKENQQCKMKLIAYPDSKDLEGKPLVALQNDTLESNQGCGPHRDSDLLTYIYQASDHTNSLEVQNFEGKWILVPNIPGTLVVNAGQTLEAVTQGVCRATIHRVITPKGGLGTRLLIPFFQTINIDLRRSILADIPKEIIEIKEARDKKIRDWAVDVGFQFVPDISKEPVGYYVFKNRIKSHQDVAKRWYPEVLKEVLLEYA